MPQTRLTPEIQKSIVAFVRAGGYPEVAAEAAGISRDLFRRWMKQADGPRPGIAIRELAQAVRQAQAQARLTAETEIRAGKPLDWLKSGPGKDAPDRPGWTGPARAEPGPEAPTFSLDDPVLRGWLARIMRALENFPEARAHVAAELQK